MNRRFIVSALVTVLTFMWLTLPASEYITPLTFDGQVEAWAKDIAEKTDPVVASTGEQGDCLPVAVQLQAKIVATGRMAVIQLVYPLPTSKIGHVLVMYNSDKDGNFDSIIDNGFATKFKVHPKEDLYEGKFGVYRGVCKDPIPEIGYCRVGKII